MPGGPTGDLHITSPAPEGETPAGRSGPRFTWPEPAAPEVPAPEPAASPVHMVADETAVMPCCGLSETQAPPADRVTMNPALVTCRTAAHDTMPDDRAAMDRPFTAENEPSDHDGLRELPAAPPGAWLVHVMPDGHVDRYPLGLTPVYKGATVTRDGRPMAGSYLGTSGGGYVLLEATSAPWCQDHLAAVAEQLNALLADEDEDEEGAA